MTRILNIDELLDESPITIVVKGKEHKMKTLTVRDFLANMKDLEALAASPGLAAETEITIRVIARAFPTLDEKEIMDWPTTAIERLFAVVRGAEPDAKVEETDAEGNAQSGS